MADGMDFAAMGTMMGAESAIANVRARADADMAAANASIIKQNGIIAKYKSALSTANAHDEALLAEVSALKAALINLETNNLLFVKTGRLYKYGAEQTNLYLIYDRAFDEYIIKDGLSNPESLRDAV